MIRDLMVAAKPTNENGGGNLAKCRGIRFVLVSAAIIQHRVRMGKTVETICIIIGALRLNTNEYRVSESNGSLFVTFEPNYGPSQLLDGGTGLF